MVFQWFFYMWTIGVDGFSMVFRFQPLVSMVFPMVLWLTIDIDGLSMVLGKVKAGSQKRPKKNKKHDLFNKYLGVNNL